MTSETKDPSELSEVQERGELSVIGAEAVDISSADATPTKTDQHGNTLTPRGLYIGTSGDVKVDLADGTTGITFKNAPAGERPWMVTKVYKLGTAAADMIFLF